MKYLALTILAEPSSAVVADFYRLVEHCACIVVESRCDWLGNALCLHALLGGAWNALAKMENAVTSLEKKYNIKLAIKRTEQRSFTGNQELYPYSIYVIAPASPSAVNQVISFFTEQNISLNEVVISAYLAPYTQVTMLSMSLSVNVPSSISLADLRDRFMLFCDDYNFDAIMGPEKE